MQAKTDLADGFCIFQVFILISRILFTLSEVEGLLQLCFKVFSNLSVSSVARRIKRHKLAFLLEYGLAHK